MPHVQRSMTFNLPLSGAVTLPWVLDWSGAQFGLVNINLGVSADPEVEHRILDEVGSYGRQLGRIGDVVEMLLDWFEGQPKPPKLTDEQRDAIQDFRGQLRAVSKIKRRLSPAAPRPA